MFACGSDQTDDSLSDPMTCVHINNQHALRKLNLNAIQLGLPAVFLIKWRKTIYQVSLGGFIIFYLKHNCMDESYATVEKLLLLII